MPRLEGEERLREDLGELCGEDSLPELVISSLAVYKASGTDFDRAWEGAMRAASPLVGRHTEHQDLLPEEMRAALDEDREILREVKPQIRSVYEGRQPTCEEVDQAALRTERRLDRLTLSGPRHRRVRAEENRGLDEAA